MYKVSKDEIKQFYVIMDHGLPIQFMIEIIFHDAASMIEELKKGKKLNDILFSQKGEYFENIRQLNTVLSMKESIECANLLESNTKGNLDEFIKQSAYPIFIFVFSFVMVLFFSNFIVPSMQIYAENGNSFLLLKILKVVFESIFILLCLISIYTLIVYKNHRKFFYQNKWVRKYTSLQFSLVLKTLLDKGLSSKSCFEMMETMKSSNSYLSNTILDYLKHGYSFEKIFEESKLFDDIFKKFFLMGMQNGSLVYMLDLYVHKEREEMKQTIKKVSNIIQIVSYASVGFLVLIVYQIMLYPLNMLNGF